MIRDGFFSALWLFALVAMGLGTGCAVPNTQGLPAPVGRLLVAAENGNVVYGTNSNIVLLIQVGGSNGNSVAGQPIVLSAKRGGDTLNPAQGVVQRNGTFTTTFRGSQAGAASVQAAVGGRTASLQLALGTPAQNESTLVLPPLALVAGKQTQWGVVAIKDDKGRGLAGVPIVVTSSNPNTVVGPQNIVSSPVGYAYFSLYDTVAGAPQITVQGEGMRFSLPISVVAGGISEARSTVALNPNNQPADGRARVTIAVTVRDDFNNIIPDIPVALRAGAQSITFGPTQGFTDASGQWESWLTSTQARLVTVSAEVTPVSSSPLRLYNQVQFSAGAKP
jgi:hypothetical protein